MTATGWSPIRRFLALSFLSLAALGCYPTGGGAVEADAQGVAEWGLAGWASLLVRAPTRPTVSSHPPRSACQSLDLPQSSFDFGRGVLDAGRQPSMRHRIRR